MLYFSSVSVEFHWILVTVYFVVHVLVMSPQCVYLTPNHGTGTACGTYDGVPGVLAVAGPHCTGTVAQQDADARASQSSVKHAVTANI